MGAYSSRIRIGSPDGNAPACPIKDGALAPRFSLLYSTLMRIVIATGIYPPEVGGPAYYAVGLAEALRTLGHDVSVCTYGVLKRLPSGIRHAAYMLKIAPLLARADVCIALDTFSVAVPSSFVCSVFRVPLIVRTGGDFVWEAYLERTGEDVLLKDFYTSPRVYSPKEQRVFSLTKRMLAHAHVVFSTDMQRAVWLSPYDLDRERTSVIGNAIEEPLPAQAAEHKNFLWHVRPIQMKNGERVHRAFAGAQHSHPDIVLEEGSMPKEKLLERMARCYAVLMPSLTEISPNYILDALRFRKPFIMDKYSGMAEELGPYGILVDPLDEADIARAISELATEDGYAKACKRAARFDKVRTYKEVAVEFIQLIEKGA